MHKKAAETNSRTLVEMATDAMIAFDREGRVLLWNPAAERIFGYRQAEAIGSLFSGLVMPAVEAERWRQDFEDASGRGESALGGRVVERELKRKDGRPFPAELSISTRPGAEGWVGIAIIRDITDRRQAEETLRASERQLRLITDALPALISYVDADQRYQFNNRAYEEWFGHERAEVHGQTLEQVLGTAAYERIAPHVKAALTGQTVTYEAEVPYKDGGTRFIRASYIPDVRLDGQVKGFFALISDMTERQRAMEEINSLARFPGENPHPVLRFGREGELLYANASSRPLLALWNDKGDGYAPEDARSLIEASLSTGEYGEIEVSLGQTIYSLIFAPVVEAGYVNVYGRDITERIHVERQLQVSLQEKDVLLKEVHHRVRNNLQAIFNLLYLQAGQIQDPQVRQMFQDSQARVKAIALVHEKLYQTTGLAQMNFAKYLTSLAQHLLHAYGADPERIALHIATGTVSLDLDTAIPLGIIINELVSNALKYAFPDGRPGEIRIEVQADQGQLRLTVSDNGVGLPEEVNPAAAGTLGLQLVSMLTSHMRGQLEFQRRAGTMFKLTLNPAWLDPANS